MEQVGRLGKYQNYILTLVVVALNVLLMGLCFDFYYDLNDDTMMRDIMAGIYSGAPDGHNMQTLYPLGALLALCYRLCRTVPWYGLFLCLCQSGCFYLVGVRLCEMADASRALQDTVISAPDGRPADGVAGGTVGRGALLYLILLSLVQWGICLPHLINVQYTITCAMLSAAAIFLFLTTAEGLSAQRFVVKNIPAMVLVILAYQLRSEMLLLTFPFICLAGLYRMTGEERIFARENLCKYGAVLGIIFVGMSVSWGIDCAAYGGEDWRDFRRFFDERTTVYDFYPELVNDDAYSGALTELGVTRQQQTLLRSYNFGLDDRIDTGLLMTMADYATDTLGAAKDWGAIAREKISYYVYRTFHGQDAPYNVIVLWAYAAVLLTGSGTCRRPGKPEAGQRTEPGAEQDGAQKAGRYMRQHVRHGARRYAFLWQLMLLAAVRSAVWMFILMRGRDPERITHSLYLVELALLAAMLVRTLYAGISRSSVARGMAALLFLIVSGGMPGQVSYMQENQRAREWVNESWYEIDAYCRSHDDNFYFEDVYSTVSFSQKMFQDVDNSYANYDIIGGWMCKSPLYYDKIGRYGITSAKEALASQDNVFLIMSDHEAVSGQGLEQIEAYYQSSGTPVAIERTDAIGDSYGVYQVHRVQGIHDKPIGK